MARDASQAQYFVLAARQVKTYTSNPVELDAIEQVVEIIEQAGQRLDYFQFDTAVNDALMAHKAQGGRVVGKSLEIAMKRRFKTKDYRNAMAFLGVLGDRLLRAMG